MNKPARALFVSMWLHAKVKLIQIRSPKLDDKGLTAKNLTWVDFLTFWTRQATTILRRQNVFVIEKPDLLPGELEWSCADYK